MKLALSLPEHESYRNVLYLTFHSISFEFLVRVLPTYFSSLPYITLPYLTLPYLALPYLYFFSFA